MGGGFVVNGRIFRAPSGEHPEVAHQTVSWNGAFGDVVCECGAKNCLEALVSGNGIRMHYGTPPEDLSAG